MPTTTPSQDRTRTWTPVEGIPAPRTDGSGGGSASGVSAVERTVPTAAVPAQAGPGPAGPGRAVGGPPVPSWALPTRVVAAPVPAQAVPRHARGRAARGRWSGAVDALGVAVGLGAVGVAGTLAALSTLLVAAPAPTVPAAPASVSPNVSVPGRVLTAVDDGIWQVGVDVAPGTYASTGPAGGATCRHALREERTGVNVTTSTTVSGAAVVALTPEDGWFETSGCATWNRVG